MYSLYTDGGSRNNPGPAAIGFVIYENDTEVAAVGKSIGIQTNNVAEYTALIEGLKKALDLDIKELNCFLDSELIVKQIKGEYKVKDQNLAKLFVQVHNLMSQFKNITFSHVLRHKNKRADELVNQALDAEK